MNLLKRTLAIVLVLATIVSPLSAEALIAPGIPGLPSLPTVPISNPAYEQKETGLTIKAFGMSWDTGIHWDLIAINFAKLTIEAITDATVDWINTRDGEGPAFVQNPKEFFRGVATDVTNQFIDENLDFLCTPFRDVVEFSIKANYGGRNADGNRPTPQCTLSRIEGNIDSFLDGRFNEGGGWNAWFSMTQNSYNNPYGSYLNATIEIDSRIAEAIGVESKILDWGRGLFSTKDANGKIVTPGAAIEGQLQGVLGTGVSQLELADEFDELIGALLGQLLQETIFSNSGLAKGYASSGGGGGSSGGGSGNSLACFANETHASIGAPITWSASGVSGILGSTVEYTWSGEEVEGQTGSTLTVVYQRGGTKNPSVSAKVLNANGEVVRTVPPVNCNNAVTISIHQPLVAICSPKTNATQLDSLHKGNVVGYATWEARVTGGSGKLRKIDMDGVGGFDETVEEASGSVTPLYGQQTTESVLTTQFRYYKEGKKSARVSVVDADPDVVPIVEQQCQGSVYVFK